MFYLQKLTGNNAKLVLVILLILTSAFFRLYKIRNYVVFLGDEGRDMIVMRNIFINHNLPFLGPTASVGGFYLGPVYYWMAAPFLFLTRYDPIGPSYMVALFGVATVLLLYRFLKESLGFWPAIISSFLYATAPLIVRYSRSSWNPNPLPFFSLLMVYSTYKAVKTNNIYYYFLTGACFGIAIQLHYLALVLAPIIGIVIFLNEKIKKIPVAILLVIIGSLLTFSPFLIFEIKNNFPNFKTILEFVTRGSTVNYRDNLSWSIADGANILIQWITKFEGSPLTRFYLWISGAVALAGMIAYWKTQKKLIFTIGFLYFFFGIFLIKLYSGQLNDYYFGSVFPAPFLAFALCAYILWKKRITKVLSVLFFVLVQTFFISKGFYKSEPNNLIEQTERISTAIIKESDSKPFNFALISPSNSDHAYRYIMEIKRKRPVQLEEEVTEQLIILCEQKECSPLGYPSWEIAGFGRSEISNELFLPEYGFKIYKLVHHQTSVDKIGKPAVKGI